MTKRKKPTEKARKAAVRKWAAAPSVNPRYKGATPTDVGRALLGKPVRAVATRSARMVSSDRNTTCTE